jgi:putative urate catabolism protein
VSAGYGRDLAGYGRTPPRADWPGGARLALSFVVNWEEGGENNVMHGDATSEPGISDAVQATAVPGQRHLTSESMFEYGSRSGVWRLLRTFERRSLPLTIFAVGMAVERLPDVVAHMAASGHEICGHGYRWIDYQSVDPATERDHIRRTVAAITAITGQRPLGWYTGRTSPHTRRLVVEEGGFLYDSDAYNDDLPYWTEVAGTPHLVLPYTLDVNDMRFVTPSGFGDGDEFFRYLRDTFDCLYAEGAEAPRMMSVGLHCRLAGRPGRTQALTRFLDHVARHDDVWVARRVDIARHWATTHPPSSMHAPALGLAASRPGDTQGSPPELATTRMMARSEPNAHAGLSSIHGGEAGQECGPG